jgi:hypothetical protein
MAPLFLPSVAKLAILRPPLRPYSPYVPWALTFYLPPEHALSPLLAPIVWPLPFLHFPPMTVLVAPVRRTLEHAPSK